MSLVTAIGVDTSEADRLKSQRIPMLILSAKQPSRAAEKSEVLRLQRCHVQADPNLGGIFENLRLESEWGLFEGPPTFLLSFPASAPVQQKTDLTNFG